LRSGDPLCTVSAEAEKPDAARAIVEERVAALRGYLLDFDNKENAA
jgi:hypothetical protein